MTTIQQIESDELRFDVDTALSALTFRPSVQSVVPWAGPFLLY